MAIKAQPQQVPKPDHPLANESVRIGSTDFRVWPDDIRIFGGGQPGIAAMENLDVLHLKRALIDRIFGVEAESRAREPSPFRGAGGQKIRNLDAFGDPFFDLIDKRAKLLYMLLYRKSAAVVDDCWANIFVAGEWANPHCHNRAEASAVLSLLPPDMEVIEDDFGAGQFYIADPRVKRCCPARDGYVTDNWMPMHGQDCLLMMFPGFVTHGVNPHHGDKKRISIAWNINDRKLPGETRHSIELDDLMMK